MNYMNTRRYKMKTTLRQFVISLTVMLGLLLSTSGMAQTNEIKKLPGYVDFGDLTSIYGEPNIEINLGPSMLQFASAIIGDADPEALSVMKGMKAIRVQIYNIDGNADAAIKQINTSRKQLVANNWEQIVKVKEDNQETHVFMKMVDGKIEGMTVLVAGDEDQAIFINIIGNIDPKDLGKITESFDLDLDIDP